MSENRRGRSSHRKRKPTVEEVNAKSKRTIYAGLMVPLADLRFLDGLGVHNERGVWSVSGVTETQESMQLLDTFAQSRAK